MMKPLLAPLRKSVKSESGKIPTFDYKKKKMKEDFYNVRYRDGNVLLCPHLQEVTAPLAERAKAIRTLRQNCLSQQPRRSGAEHG